MLSLVLITLCLLIIYFLIERHYRYWKKRGISGPSPTFLIGNVWQCLKLRKSYAEVYAEIYHDYNEPCVGIFRTLTPSLIIRDPDLIKEFMVKDFNNFHDNDVAIDMRVDPLLGRHPFFLKGDKWKIARAQLTPSFTSGKMKNLHPLIEEVCHDLVNFIAKQQNAFNGQGIEAKDLALNFTLNNVATCAFGLEGRCFDDPNSRFRVISDKFLAPDGWASFKLFMVTTLPFLQDYVSIKFTSKEAEDGLMKLVSEILQYREEKNITRNDFLHSMSELKKADKTNEFTNVDITAHAASFLLDGYETSSIVMSFILFELAQNPKIQRKVRKEINEVFDKNDGRLPFVEIEKSMPYIDAVYCEALRMYPPLPTLTRRCTKSHSFTLRTTGRDVDIEENTTILIPLSGLHYDEKYFENPRAFNPDRFLGDENKNKIVKYVFMPFGEGPRACLGKRFGNLQLKLGLSYILRNYEISLNSKTKTPLKFNPVYFLLDPIGGVWIDFKKI